MRHWLLAVVLVTSACGDDPPPVVVSHGRLTAEIDPEPAQIRILLDGTEVWSTRAGGSPRDKGAPHGFAATGAIAAQIAMSFGSYKFDENEATEVWRPIDKLGSVDATATGASFTLLSGDTPLGTGTLTFDDAIEQHVRIELVTDSERVQLAATTSPEEHLVGLGGMSFTVDHQGEFVPLWVQEDGISKRDIPDDDYSGPWILEGRKHSTHTPMPMMLSSNGYALAIDTTARITFALGSEAPDVARFDAWDHTLDLHLFVRDTSRDALGDMLTWVGKPPRPPETIFAPWIDALLGSANVRAVAAQLRAEGIASSVIWTEDWRGGEQTTITGYALHEDWRVDRELYPDFEALADDLRALGFAFHTYHNTFIDETADVRDEAYAGGYTIKTAAGAPYEFTGVKFTPTSLLDLTNPAAVAWGKATMSEARTIGSDGWMADFAEWLPVDAVLASGEDALYVHNRYPVEWAKFNQELFSTPIPGRPDPIYFMRAAWLHSQPYVQVVWAGDQQTDWEVGDGLPSVIPIGLGLGVTGFPYFGHDIGGYMSQGTMPTSEELFYRWTTLGALSPVMRTHHGREIQRNVQWNYDAGTIAHFRRWTQFHLQLAPYFIGGSSEYEQTGMPLFRMIALDYPDEPWAWTTVDEYLLGDRILVAPIVTQGVVQRTLQLPAGEWYPLFGGPAVTGGGGELVAAASRTEIPAFVPAGTLLVLFPAGVHTMLPAPASAATTTTLEAGDNREVWLWPGTAEKSAHGQWHSATGPLGTPEWTWTGRPASAALPTAATFNGMPAPITTDGLTAVVTVTGDGVLTFADGGTLTIARTKPSAVTTVRVH